jgi:hypothetical protein
MNRAKKIAVKKVTNWITQEYIQKRNEVEAAGGRVSDGFLGELIKQAIANDEMLDESFSVSKQTINARKKKKRPTVWHPGTRSPVEAAEPILVSMITKAHKLNAPWTVGQCKAAMNELIKGTKIEADIIAQRIKDRCYDPSKPLLGKGWWRGFKRRNEAVVKSCVGKKYARNRSEHCTYDAIFQMYVRSFNAFVEPGNARRLPEPQHVDRDDNVVEDAVNGYGHQANIVIDNPDNIYVMDETGCNTGGRNDKNNASEKLVCPTGVTPKQEVGIKDEHFTVLPVTNLAGVLVLIVIIFEGERLLESWCFSLDVFAEEEGFGPGKRYPGCQSCTVGDKKVPCYFACSPNASMTSGILKDVFEFLDEQHL